MPPAEVVPILDRYLMFYIRTADKLQRTAPWLESLPGGVNYLREVVIDDKLGICASLETQMRELVDSFFDEWAEVLRTPALAAKFKQFQTIDGDKNCDSKAEPIVEEVEVEVEVPALTSGETTPPTPVEMTPVELNGGIDTDADRSIEQEQDRGQARPAFWARDPATDDFRALSRRWTTTSWHPVMQASHFAGADDLPNGISATVKRGDTQLALWRFRGRYYATQQMCPHKRAFVLSEGLLGEPPADSASPTPPGSSGPSPWVSCPLHKRNFDLASGDCKTDDSLSIATFPAEERPDGLVYLLLPPEGELDAALGTAKWRVKAGEAGEHPFAELDRKIQFKGIRGRKPSARPLASAGMKTRPVELLAGGGCGSAPDW